MYNAQCVQYVQCATVMSHDNILKVIYHSSMVWVIMSVYGVIGYHVTLSEGHMIANHPI